MMERLHGKNAEYQDTYYNNKDGKLNGWAQELGKKQQETIYFSNIKILNSLIKQ